MQLESFGVLNSANTRPCPRRLRGTSSKAQLIKHGATTVEDLRITVTTVEDLRNREKKSFVRENISVLTHAALLYFAVLSI